MALMEHALGEQLIVLKYLIPSLYTIIAVQFLVSAKSSKNGVRRVALFALTAIFLLCSFSGYISPVFGISEAVTALSHIIQALCCVVFILTNQAAKAMQD